MLLTIKETAKFLKISETTIYRWVHQKKIQYTKLGSRVLFLQENLEEFIRSNTVEKDVA